MRKLYSFYTAFLCFILLGASQLMWGQTILTAGDIAIVEANSDGNDNFAFVILKPIAASTIIRFTDNGWDNSGSFRNNEGILEWTAPVGGVSCGTIVHIDNTSSGTISASSGTISKINTSFSLSTDGDQILAYQGTESSPIFIAAINFGAGNWSNATTSNNSGLPPGLTNGTNCLYVGGNDNWKYNITNINNTKANVLASINNSANWTSHNSTVQNYTGTITVTDCEVEATTTDIVFTEINSSETDVVEFMSLARLNESGALSSYKFTSDGLESDKRFRGVEGDYTASGAPNDIPEGTFVRIMWDETGTNETDASDGLITLYTGTLSGTASGLNANDNGEQVIAFTGTKQTSSGINTFKGGINFGSTGGWLTSGTPDNNTSYAPGTETDFARTATGGNHRYNSSITGNKATIIATSGNATRSSSAWTSTNGAGNRTLKTILFNESNRTSGAISTTTDTNSITINTSGVVFGSTTSSTRYLVVVGTGTLGAPVDRYTCTYNANTNFGSAPTVVTSVTGQTATNFCGTPTNGNGKVVYFGYEKPSNLTVTNLPVGNYNVAVYAVNGNGYTANFGTTSGVGTAQIKPVIAVKGNDTVINHGSETTSATNHTDFGNVGLTQSLVRTFTIENTGNAALTLGTIALSGTNTNQFSLTQASSATVNASGSTTFTVTFSPTSTGLKTATVTIPNNDNTNFTFTVSGNGVENAPNIQINAYSNDGSSVLNIIADADDTPATLDGTQLAESRYQESSVKNFRITNTGVQPLTVGSITLKDIQNYVGTGDYTLTSDDSPHFTLTDGSGNPLSFPLTIAAGSFADYRITFSPRATGWQYAMVTLNNNVPNDKNPFTYVIRANGLNPNINVSGNNNPIANNSMTTSTVNDTFMGYANIQASETITKTYTIKNTGNTTLNISNITSGNAQFTVSATSFSNIAVNAEVTFNITFTPLSNGLQTSAIAIISDDKEGIFTISDNSDDKSPFDFIVQANAQSFVPCAAISPVKVTESFTNLNLSNTEAGSYRYREWTGDDGKIWKATSARTDQILNGKAICFSDSGSDPKTVPPFVLTAPTYTTGIGKLKFSFKRAFTGGSDRTLQVYVNGTQIGSNITVSPTSDDTQFYERDINISGTFTLEIKSITNGQVIIDDIEWTSYGGETVAEKTWNGTSWSGNGLPPTSFQKAVFVENYTSNEDASLASDGILHACACEVAEGKKVTISPNHTFEVEDYIVNNGNIEIQSDANLIQKNDIAAYTSSQTDHFKVIRNSMMKRLDYIYWGSPVEGQTFKDFSPNTVASRFYRYNETYDSFITISPLTDPMIAGEGYAIRAPNNQNATESSPWSGIFTGKPHNGIVTRPVTKSPNSLLDPNKPESSTNPIIERGKNMLANPYPSNLDLEVLTDSNPSTATGVYYFWTNTNDFHDNTQVPGNGSYGNYATNHYATYNTSGAVPAANAMNDQLPTRFIRPGQGFLYEASAEGTVIFNNEMRSSNQDSHFISSRGTSVAPERFWLKLTTPIGNYNTLLIAYIAGATNAYEKRYDAKYPGQGSDRFYSVNDNQKLIIHGRQYPFIDTDMVPLGMSAFVNGNYSINIVRKEGVFENGQAIFLKDKQTGIVTNLSEGEYSFVSNEGEINDRFEIVYKPESVLLSQQFEKDKMKVYRDGNDFVIKSTNKKISEIRLYDTSGRLLLAVSPDSLETRLNGNRFPNGVYILHINRNHEWTTKKIVK